MFMSALLGEKFILRGRASSTIYGALESGALDEERCWSTTEGRRPALMSRYFYLSRKVLTALDACAFFWNRKPVRKVRGGLSLHCDGSTTRVSGSGPSATKSVERSAVEALSD